MLVKQLVLVKRDNARYKEELAQLKDSMTKDESDKKHNFPRKQSSGMRRNQAGNDDVNVRSLLPTKRVVG